LRQRPELAFRLGSTLTKKMPALVAVPPGAVNPIVLV